MSRIMPPNSGDYLINLEDDTPYRATIHKIEWEDSEYKGKQQTQMVLYWALDKDPSLPGVPGDLTIREYVGMRLGTTQSGQVSKLRAILNAIGNQPKNAEIAWFDDETLEWSYDGEKPYAKLDVGLPAIIRGETVEKKTENGTKRRFAITGYRPSGIAEKPPAPKPVRGRAAAEPERAIVNRPAVVKNDDTDEDIPF